MNDAPGLLEFCTNENQRKALKTIIKHGGNKTQAAKELGVHLRSLGRMVERIRKKAVKRGFSPEHDMTNTTPEGFHVKGISTLYDADGKPKIQWVKTDSDKEAKTQAILDVIEDYSLPVMERIKSPKKSDKDLCTVYTITDFHLGAYSYGKETGDDWDIDIAEKVLVNAFADLMNGSPNSEQAVFAQLGDFLHWDGMDAVTPMSGHLLDADTRFAKLVELSIDVCVKIVGMLLEKHKNVQVLMCEGNHDMASSVWMQKLMKKIYSDNPRVNVDDSEFPFYAFKHGKVMLAFHHGHKVKNQKLPALFASEPRYRKMWGDSMYTYIHTGHYHHTEQTMSEEGGAIVERHPTLAGRDAYAARGGWVSHRAARAITYHADSGEDTRVTKIPRG